MKTKTEILIELWIESRTRFTNQLKNIAERQTDEDWETSISTKEFGAKTKAEAFGRIVSHTAYHAGQLAIIHKYGNI